MKPKHCMTGEGVSKLGHNVVPVHLNVGEHNSPRNWLTVAVMMHSNYTWESWDTAANRDWTIGGPKVHCSVGKLIDNKQKSWPCLLATSALMRPGV